MKPKNPPNAAGANCVGRRRRAKSRVLRPARIKRSWDNHRLAIQPGHRLAQRHRLQTILPKSAEIHRPAQLRKTRLQEHRKPLTALTQPPPPAAYRPAVQAHPSGAAVRRTTHQQQLQHQLLNGPAIPAPGSHALRQTRTRMAATRAEVTWNRDGIERSGSERTSIRLALITAMPPKPGKATMRTSRRTINDGLTLKGVEMLLQRSNCWHNAMHRLVSSEMVKASITSHDNRGAPAFLVSELFRDKKVKVLSDDLNEPGMVKS